MKKAVVLIMVLIMLVGLVGCGKSEEAKNVEAMIDAIGEVTKESGPAIIAAEDAYNDLSEEDKESIDNYSVLTDARENYESQLTAFDRLIYDEEVLVYNTIIAGSSLFKDPTSVRLVDYGTLVDTREDETADSISYFLVVELQANNSYGEPVTEVFLLNFLDNTIEQNPYINTLGISSNFYIRPDMINKAIIEHWTNQGLM